MSQMRDADMPLPDRIGAALKRMASRQGLMRVPAEATDPDIVLADCGREISALRIAIGVRDQQIAELREQLRRARELLEAWDDLDFEEWEGPDGAAVLIDQHEFDTARDGLDEFLRPPAEDNAP